MFASPSCLPDDLLARLKQYDVTIVPSNLHQERQPHCSCQPEINSGNKTHAPRHRLLQDHEQFQIFENVSNAQDSYSSDAKRRNWFQSKDQHESMTSSFDLDTHTTVTSAINRKFPVKSGDEEMMFSDYRPLSQQELQESTPRRKLRTEDTTNTSFQHKSNSDRFQKVIFSKLMGHHTNVQPRPRKRLRFDDATSGNIPDSFQPEVNRKRSFSYMSNGYDNGQRFADVTMANIPESVHSCVREKESYEHGVCKGYDTHTDEPISKCYCCEQNEPQYSIHSQNRESINGTPKPWDRACQFPSLPEIRGNHDYPPKTKDVQGGSSICACAAMRLDFVKMAERAYRNIRRRDPTPSRFDQFLVEINTTNELLRQTLEVLKNIREMCDHVARI